MKKPLDRNNWQKVKDFLFFPIRAVTLFETDRWGLTCLRSERFYYVASFVTGKCLDLGCGRNNTFIKEFLHNQGIGLDVFPYSGLKKQNLVKDFTKLPFTKESFQTVTFIACLNHAPYHKRDKELKEAYRCLKKGGRVVVTMGNPLAEVLVHKLVYIYDKVLGTHIDVDSERKMDKDEHYFLTDEEIIGRLAKAKFKNTRKVYFWTQWGLNHLLVAEK